MLLLKDHSAERFPFVIGRSFMISFISNVHYIMRDSLVCKTTHARALQAQLNTTLCSEIGMDGIDRLCCPHDGTQEQPVPHLSTLLKLAPLKPMLCGTVTFLVTNSVRETPIAIFFFMASITLFLDRTMRRKLLHPFRGFAQSSHWT